MASLDVDGPHLETGESENGGGQVGHREGQGCGELGARMLSLDRTAGPAGWVPRPPRSSALVIYEEEREKRDSWGGDSWRILLSRSVAEGKLGSGRCGLVGLGGGRGGRK